MEAEQGTSILSPALALFLTVMQAWIQRGKRHIALFVMTHPGLRALKILKTIPEDRVESCNFLVGGCCDSPRRPRRSTVGSVRSVVIHCCAAQPTGTMGNAATVGATVM